VKFAQFRKHKLPPGSVYLFVCADDYLVDESQAVWRDHFAGDWDFEKMTLREFDDLNASDLADEARSPRLFGGSRAIMVKVADAARFTKKRIADVEPLASLTRSSVKVVFVFDQRPGRGRLPFPSVEIDALRTIDTIHWLESRFEIPPDVARYMVEHMGSELLPLKQEAEKLRTYAGGTRPIEIADVDQLIFRSERYGPFALDDAFMNANYTESIRIIGSMLEDGVHALLVLSKLTRVWRQLFVARTLGRASDSDVARLAGVPTGIAGKILRASRRFEWDDLVGGFRLLVEADHAFKSSSTNPELYLDILLWKLLPVSGGPRQPERTRSPGVGRS
jgi:DNA polymerase III delta subunit